MIQFSAYHVLPDSPQMQQMFLQAVASLEARSVHPLAADVVRVAKLNHLPLFEVSGFQEIPQQGIGGLVTFSNEERPYAMVVGSRAFLRECGLNIPDILEVTARKWEAEENTFIALGGWDSWVRGVLKFVWVRD